MHKLRMRLPLAGFGLAICALSPTAQSQTAADARCPGGFWLTDVLCMNEDAGEVVEVARAAASRAVVEPGCAPGYARLDRLCVNAATGDVELVDEKAWRSDQRAQGRN